MKKLISCLIGVVVASVVSAAQIDWGAGDFSPVFKDSTAYLVQANGTATIADVIYALATTGVNTDYNKNDFKVLSQEGTSFFDGVAYVDSGCASGIDAGNYGGLFVVVVSADGTQFVISNSYKTVTVDANTPADAMFGEFGSTDGWTEAELGHDTPSVPEPTVLALLALGVAGLALKRRV